MLSPQTTTIAFYLLLNLLSDSYAVHRYDIAQHLAGHYKWLAQLLFIVQLFVSLAIVVISTIASCDGRAAEDCADEEDCENGEGACWIVSDSSTIITLGEAVFCLTVGASFLISFDSYINAKAPSQPLTACCS